MIDLIKLKAEFRKRFDREPRIFRAPGRVNLIGEHTDYNDGFVLPAAIQYGVVVAAAEREDRRLMASSMQFPEILDADLNRLDGLRTAVDWTRYVIGVAALLERQGNKISGADLLIESDIPTGAGLSSSAALETCIATALTSLSGLAIDGVEIAKIGRATENEFIGVRSGIMDQFASVFGRRDNAIFLDCRSLEWEAVPLGKARFVVCDTRTKHDLAEGEYNRRRAECEEAARAIGVSVLRDATLDGLEGAKMRDVIFRRAGHVINENARVLTAVEALREGDLDKLGRLMCNSHASLRDDFEVSCRELDAMVDIAMSLDGVLGARMTGGGFGGCTINLLAPDAEVEELAENISEQYLAAVGIEPRVYECRISDGAGEVV